MNRRILTSLLVIGLVGATAGMSTTALFNDEETSADNVFTSGELDLKIDWKESYNGEQIERQEYTDNPGPVFSLDDVKPGDHGESTVSLHVFDNPAWLWMKFNETSNWDNSCTDPEHDAEGTCGSEGELDDKLEMKVWYDDGDNTYEDGEKVIFDGTVEELDESRLGGGLLLDAAEFPNYNGSGNYCGAECEDYKSGRQPIMNSTDYYVGIKWNLPKEVGNEIQGDSLKMDFDFYAEQHRHNSEPDNPWNHDHDNHSH